MHAERERATLRDGGSSGGARRQEVRLGGRTTGCNTGSLGGLDGKALTVVDAAYRFYCHEPGVHVVLSGTGSSDHLKANIESLTKPPLPEPVTARLREIFGKVDCITGN